MAKRRTGELLLTLLAVVACDAMPAEAEWKIDFHGGAAWIQSSDLDVRGQDSTGASVALTIFDVDANTGFSVGTRAGYWLGSAPFFGLGLDVFYLDVRVPAQTETGTATLTGQSETLPVFDFSPELRLPWPLMIDAQFPKGEWQPYINAGPAWAFGLRDDSLPLELGGKVGAGVALSIVRGLALYGEDRHTFFPGFKLTDGNLTYKADLNAHGVSLGVSLRF